MNRFISVFFFLSEKNIYPLMVKYYLFLHIKVRFKKILVFQHFKHFIPLAYCLRDF